MRRLGLVAVLLVSWAMAGPVLASPPANDDFVNAEQLAGIPASVTGTFGGATAEFGEPHCNVGVADDADNGVREEQVLPYSRASVWYRLPPVSAPQVVAILAAPGERRGPWMDVFTGTSLDRLAPVTCDRRESKVRLEPGTEYHVRVAGDDEMFAFDLDYSDPPENDSFGAAATLTLGPYDHYFGNSDTASIESGEPRSRCALDPGGSLWFRSVPERTAVVSIHTGVYEDVTVTVYEGSALDSLVPVVCKRSIPNEHWVPDGGTGATFVAEAGKTYYVQLSGEFGWSGYSSLSAWARGYL